MLLADAVHIPRQNSYQRFRSVVSELSDPNNYEKRIQPAIFLGKVAKKLKYCSFWLKGFDFDSDGEFDLDSAVSVHLDGKRRITYASVDKSVALIEDRAEANIDLWCRVNCLSSSGMRVRERSDGSQYRLPMYALDGYHNGLSIPKKDLPLVEAGLMSYVRSPNPIFYKNSNNFGFLTRANHVRFVIDIDHDLKLYGRPLEYQSLLMQCERNGIRPWWITQTHHGGFHIVLNGDYSFRFFNYRLAMACRLVGESPNEFGIDLRDIHLKSSDEKVKEILKFLEDNYGVDRSYLIAKPDNQVSRLVGSNNFKRGYWCNGDVIDSHYQYKNRELKEWLDEYYCDVFWGKYPDLDDEKFIDSRFVFRSFLYDGKVKGYVNNASVSISYSDYIRLIEESGITDRDYEGNHQIYRQILQKRVSDVLAEVCISLDGCPNIDLYPSDVTSMSKINSNVIHLDEYREKVVCSESDLKITTSEISEIDSCGERISRKEWTDNLYAKNLGVNSSLIEEVLKLSSHRPIVKRAKLLADFLAMRINFLRDGDCGIGQVKLCDYLNENGFKCSSKTAENYLRYLVREGYLRITKEFEAYVSTHRYGFGEKLCDLAYEFPKVVKENSGVFKLLEVEYERGRSNEMMMCDIRLYDYQGKDAESILDIVYNKYMRYVTKCNPDEVRSKENICAMILNWKMKKKRKAA